MGLDAFEIVMRAEEVFCVELPDSDLASANRVGDLYLLICHALAIEPPADVANTNGFAQPL